MYIEYRLYEYRLGHARALTACICRNSSRFFLSSFVSCSCYRVCSNTLELSDKNHQPQFFPRCIDAHAIQKDGSSEEQLAMNDDDHQNLICNFGNPQENRNHHQQHLGSIVLFSGTVTDGYVAYQHPK